MKTYSEELFRLLGEEEELRERVKEVIRSIDSRV